MRFRRTLDLSIPGALPGTSPNQPSILSATLECKADVGLAAPLHTRVGSLSQTARLDTSLHRNPSTKTEVSDPLRTWSGKNELLLVRLNQIRRERWKNTSSLSLWLPSFRNPVSGWERVPCGSSPPCSLHLEMRRFGNLAHSAEMPAHIGWRATSLHRVCGCLCRRGCSSNSGLLCRMLYVGFKPGPVR
jgi:hypothetical protein